MWKLTDIYAQNICAFHELVVNPQSNVTTLIFGENRDDDSQQSNGAGKSALLECISFGLTGSPLRKVKNEEIINDHSEQSYIELILKNTITQDMFIIERNLFRKGSSTVQCRIKKVTPGGSVVQEISQPSVEAYNRFILETLGISKEELFNNFLLSKHRYQNFLSCSDKEKKEIVNRFSNANLVDEAIERILEDKVPYQELFTKTEMDLARLQGRVNMLKEQIEENEKEMRNRKSDQEKTDALIRLIDQKKGLLQELSTKTATLSNELQFILTTEKEIQKIELKDYPLIETVQATAKFLDKINASFKTDWSEIIRNKRKDLHTLENELKEWETNYAECKTLVTQSEEVYKKLEADCLDVESSNRNKSHQLEEEKELLEGKSRQLNENLQLIKQEKRDLSSIIENLKNILAGVIACPSCGSEFIVSCQKADTSELRNQLQQEETRSNLIAKTINCAESEIVELEALINNNFEKRKCLKKEESELKAQLQQAEYTTQSIKNKCKLLQAEGREKTDRLKKTREDFSNLRRNIFDSACEHIDTAYRTTERNLRLCKEETEAINGSIQILEQSLIDMQNPSSVSMLEKLKESYENYGLQAEEATMKRLNIQQELFRLNEQEQNFVHFKTYLANSKIGALAKLANEFLENTGSDIRLKLSGYTFLKTGKIREKISVSLLRDGVDCGSFGKFSEGEAARVNLATILAMQKLINSNCEIEKGLDLLVMDEILESVDETGLSSMFEALNKLKVTALVVSHGNIAESYPYILKVIKQNGESKIQE